MPITRPRLVSSPVLLAVALAAAGLLAACDVPRDPEGTLERVRGGTLRVGVADAPPWVVAGEPPGGIEPELVRRFAAELGAEVVWRRGAAHELIAALERYELDLVVGGFTEGSPGLKGAISNPYVEARLTVGTEGAPLDGLEPLEGREVSVRADTEAAALVAREGLVAREVESLADAPAPLAAESWYLEARGLAPAGATLAPRRHVMLAPPGENGFLVRLERFLHGSGDEIRALLLEAAP